MTSRIDERRIVPPTRLPARGDLGTYPASLQLAAEALWGVAAHPRDGAEARR